MDLTSFAKSYIIFYKCFILCRPIATSAFYLLYHLIPLVS